MLLPCVRAFLGEFLQQVERSEIPAKHWLGAANQVLKLTTSQRARKIADQAEEYFARHVHGHGFARTAWAFHETAQAERAAPLHDQLVIAGAILVALGRAGS